MTYIAVLCVACVASFLAGFPAGLFICFDPEDQIARRRGPRP